MEAEKHRVWRQFRPSTLFLKAFNRPNKVGRRRYALESSRTPRPSFRGSFAAWLFLIRPYRVYHAALSAAMNS